MALRTVRGDGRGIAAACALTALLLAPSAHAGSVAEPPRATVETAFPEMPGRTIEVPESGDLRAALDRARPGDTIELQPGVVYRGPFELPRKRGDGWIVITTAGADDTLPRSGTRVTKQHADSMAVLAAGHGSVITAAAGAGYYRFVGVKIRPERGKFLHNLVSIGTEGRTLEELPHHIVFDRCVLLGDAEAGTRRGIAMNARDMAVVDSYLGQFKEQGADSQAIAGWNGPGPFLIENNFIEGAGENVMFGGAVSIIDQLVPADITVRGNHFSKPLRWMVDHPEYAGKPWTVKNLFELKNARRVLIEGNLFEYSWLHAQTGFAILFTVRDEDGAMPWAVVEDVIFADNVVRHAGGGISFLGRDGGRYDEARTRRILIENNVFEDIGGEWGGGRLFQMIDGTADVVIRDNVADQTGSIVVTDGGPHEGFVFVGNVVPHNEYGIVGDGTLPGTRTLERHFPGSRVEGNAIIGGRAASYPPGNEFPRVGRQAAAKLDVARLCSALGRAGPALEVEVCERT